MRKVSLFGVSLLGNRGPKVGQFMAQAPLPVPKTVEGQMQVNRSAVGLCFCCGQKGHVVRNCLETIRLMRLITRCA